ncbi:MAG: hypothetical protein K0R18_491 [Bacillales bacterium]|jgi:hypothetical protein|nr:hypothetical protein [Bacillales bacterium]
MERIKLKLTIGTMSDTPKSTNRYEIEVKFMHGDADAYTKEYVRIPSEKIELVEEVLATLHKFKNLPWNEARNSYSKHAEYKLWFGHEYLGSMDGEPAYDEDWPEEITYEKWEEIGQYSFEWPRDVTYREIDARLDGFKVFYYNENGVKFNVEVEF